ncbi:VOC family protein [Oceanobacillus halotolerans]|uniref:hypothetical protein n=1 Tax=Oceanobacillus halotolerans TaxID=2663380 RepID=UPI0013DAAFB9|nr:hypothetical protein [Oceanobacillus halotolerans]
MLIDFFGHELGCYVSPKMMDQHPTMCPGHFGITFLEIEAYKETLKLAVQHEVLFFKKPMIHLEGTGEEHMTYFLLDPTNNVIQFRYYSYLYKK